MSRSFERLSHTGKRPLSFLNEAKGTDSGMGGCVQALDAFSTPGSQASTFVSKKSSNFHTVYYAFIHCLKVLFYCRFKNKVLIPAVTPLLGKFLFTRLTNSKPHCGPGTGR